MFEQSVIDKEALKKLVREKKVKNIDDLNVLARNLLKDTIDIMLEEELKDSLGYEKYDYKEKQTDNSRNDDYIKTMKKFYINQKSIGLAPLRDLLSLFRNRYPVKIVTAF